ncbi:MAG: EI24 domain-containing protein [Myxococcales bacterium]|nr:EI24 domain-containing protein [Myxococcales bacterium]
MAYSVPKFQPRSAITRFFIGVRYPFRGIRIVVTNPRLWPYLVFPVVINLTVFLGALVVAWFGAAHLIEWLWPQGTGVEPPLQDGLSWLLVLGVRVVLFFITGVTFYFSAGIVAIPFNDRLSDQIETMILGPYEEDFSWSAVVVDVLQSILHSVLSLTLWLLVMGSLFVLQVVPVLGALAYVLVGIAFTALFLGREMMDGSMSRRRMRYRHKLRVVWSNRAVLMGFGMVASIVLWIPGLNFLMMPMVVAGGTMLFCHLELSEAIPGRAAGEPWVSNRRRVGKAG